jgi:hypothetical protein
MAEIIPKNRKYCPRPFFFIFPSCEISPEKNKIKPLHLAIENLQNHLIFEIFNL